MHCTRLTTDADSVTGTPVPARACVLSCLGMLLAVTGAGCVVPCFGPACNSTEPLYVSPMARFGAVERRLPECEPPKGTTAWPYFTMGKYWPKLDEWKTSRTAASAARKVLWKQMWDTKSWINAHYREGFTQAYIDVANGGNGEVPPVPPPRYWNTHFRSAKGQWRAERWFDGYRAGAAMALVEMQPLRRVTASYDWSIEKPKPPFVSSPLGVGNIGPAPACPPVMQTGGFGVPGQQRFAPRPARPSGWTGQQMTPGYGPAPWGQPAPGTPSSMPGPPRMPPPPAGMPQFPQAPNAVPGTGPMQAPGRDQPFSPPQPPSDPLSPGFSGPGTDGVAPSPAGPAPNVNPGPNTNPNTNPGPNGGAQFNAPQPIPQQLAPGFLPFANRPDNIPQDDPVWRTRPPEPSNPSETGTP